MSIRKGVDFHKDWPALTEDGKIPTAQFLDTCQVILQVLGTMGHLFLPVKRDIEGNIKKLHVKFERNPSRYATLHDMITIDISSAEPPCAVESLKWLKRGLHFVYLLLDSVVESHERQKDDLQESCLKAYEISLKNYHNWVLQKFALACIRTICPSREHFLLCIRSCDDDVKNEEMFAKLKQFVAGLENNLQWIFTVYVEYGLDTVKALK